MALLQLQNLLTTLLAKIREDTQYDDVEEDMVEIEKISKTYDTLVGALMEKINEELYEYKGVMAGVKPELLEMLYVVDDLLAHGFK